MRYNILANVINLILGYVFIFGFWFVPGMGVAGAGIASTIAKIAGCILALYAIFDQRSSIPVILNLKDKFRLDFTVIKRILNIGYAAAGEQMVLRVGMLIFHADDYWSGGGLLCRPSNHHQFIVTFL